MAPLLRFLLIVCWAARAFCGPCQSFQGIASNNTDGTTFFLGVGACYSATSGTSSPSLIVLPGPATTWASSGAPQLLLPVLDLRNQVQNIWLLEGKWSSQSV